MLEGVHLTLLVGPVVPVPVPQFVLDALTQVEVSAPDEAAGAFTLQFTLSVQSPLHTLFLLSGGGVVPLLRVIVVVTLNGMPQVLIDGVVTRTEVLPGADQRHTTLQVSGDDLTTVMTKLEFSGLPGLPYPAMPAEAIVALLLAKYAFLGIVPLVIPSIADRRADPDQPHPDPAGHRPRVHPHAGRTTSATCSTSIPARRPA